MKMFMFSVILLVSSLHLVESDLRGGKSMQFKNMVNTADYQLSMDLLANYPAGYNVMPVSNPHDVLNVSLQLALYHIVDMNERAQTLTTNCEIITKWHDVFLMWDPSDYDNITDTRLPWDKVWTPDIVLYNSAGDGEQGREMRTLIQVTYDGNVTLLTQAIYMSKCTIDVTYYPFDAQQCELKFASWSTEVTRLNMTIGKIDRKKILSLYSPSGVFELKKIFARRHEMPDPCCEDAFADVTYYLVIWRRPKFFLFNYIQPAVLINILALFVFLIPAESGEKITLGISTMLNMTVFLMTVMSGLPPTDQTPILSIYYAVTMVLTTAATVLGVIVLRLHHQGRRGIPVPNYLRTVARWMALFSYSSYPPIEKQLENLNKGTYKSVAPDDYCYNIKDYDHMFPKKKSPIFRQRPWFNHKPLSSKTDKPSAPHNISTTAQHHQLQDIPHLNTRPVVKKIVKNGKPVFSPKGSQKLRKAKLYSSKDNISKKDVYSETVHQNSVVIQIEDGETDTLLGPNPQSRDLLYPEPTRDLPYPEPMLDLQYPVSPSPTPDTRVRRSDPTTADRGLRLLFMLLKVKVLWRKAASSEKEKKKEVSPKPELSGAWKDLTNKMMEERWKAEERKEIIGEEWRKISRIFDRFLLIVFVIMSLINTIWCIFTSPHFPDSETDDEDIPDFK